MDMRVPVVIGDAADLAEGDVVLAIPRDQGGHVPGCSCCGVRGAAALALGNLFLARARGEAPWFSQVIATCADPVTEIALREALANDPIAAARFRLVP